MENEEIYRSLRVKRWHQHGELDQTIGQHVSGMLLLLLKLHPEPSANLMIHIALHDCHEYVFGDLSHWTKKKYPDISQADKESRITYLEDNNLPNPDLTEDEIVWVAFLEQYEAYMFLKTNPYKLSPVLLNILEDIREDLRRKTEDLIDRGFYITRRIGLPDEFQLR